MEHYFKAVFISFVCVLRMFVGVGTLKYYSIFQLCVIVGWQKIYVIAKQFLKFCM